MARIGIIGFGFSGLMAAANLLRETTTPITLYIIDEHADGRGVAYSTTNPDHLLNVRAGNMSAFADDKNHLINWLASDAGKYAAATHRLRSDYAATEFIPRMLYGDYLDCIWRTAQEIAAQKSCSIKLVPSQAVAIQPGETPAVLTMRGDAIAVDHIVLAVGHETKPILAEASLHNVIQNPWGDGALDGVKNSGSPVLTVGSGLTMVDVLLTLRRNGYEGQVIAASMTGQVPRTHAAPTPPYAFKEEELLQQKTPSNVLRLVRARIVQTGNWRAVVDGLRPHTVSLWQRLTTAQKFEFLRRLNTFWSVHRHRMAPEVAARIDAEIAAQTLIEIRSKSITPMADGTVVIRTQSREHVLHPSVVINCTGFELDLTKSTNPLLRQLIANGLVEAHETRLGISADQHCRAWGALHPKLFVLGSLLTGQLLESTAVPELRAQAVTIANAIRKR